MLPLSGTYTVYSFGKSNVQPSTGLAGTSDLTSVECLRILAKERSAPLELERSAAVVTRLPYTTAGAVDKWVRRWSNEDCGRMYSFASFDGMGSSNQGTILFGVERNPLSLAVRLDFNTAVMRYVPAPCDWGPTGLLKKGAPRDVYSHFEIARLSRVIVVYSLVIQARA